MRAAGLLVALIASWAAAQPSQLLAVDAWRLEAVQKLTMQHLEETSSRRMFNDYLAESVLRGRLERTGTNSFSGTVLASVTLSYRGEVLSSSTSQSAPDCGLTERFSNAGPPGAAAVASCFAKLDLDVNDFEFSLLCDPLEIVHTYEWVDDCGQRFDYDEFIPRTWWWDTSHVLMNVPPSNDRYAYPAGGTELSVNRPEVEALAGMSPWFTAIADGEFYPGKSTQAGTLSPAGGGLHLVVQATEAYERWMPSVGPSGPGEALELTARVVDDEGLQRSSPTISSITWQLTDTSKEPGVTINFPVHSQDTAFDLVLSPGEEAGTLDETRQKLTRSEVNEAFDTAWIVPSDWGGWSTLHVTAKLSDGQQLTAKLSSTKEEAIRIPWRTPDSHVATAWKKTLGVENLADGDDAEAGDGDGLTLYEEYRGVRLQALHRRLDPQRRELIVHIRDLGGVVERGLARYERAANVTVHFTREDDECEANDTPLLVTNVGKGAHRVDQHAVRIEKGPADLDDALIQLDDPTLAAASALVPGDGRFTAQRAGTPKDIRAIYVFTRLGHVKVAEQVAVIAHELGHATNLRHHAFDGKEVGPRTWVPANGGLVEGGVPIRVYDDVTGSDITAFLAARIKPSGKTLVIGGRNGTNSGHENCLMRYTEADGYLAYSSPTNERFAILKRDSELRTSLCRGREGATFNAPARFPQTRFDSTDLGFCFEDVRVRDRN